MLTKTAIALALILGTASGTLAAAMQHSTAPSHDVYDARGAYVGSGPGRERSLRAAARRRARVRELIRTTRKVSRRPAFGAAACGPSGHQCP